MFIFILWGPRFAGLATTLLIFCTPQFPALGQNRIVLKTGSEYEVEVLEKKDHYVKFILIGDQEREVRTLPRNHIQRMYTYRPKDRFFSSHWFEIGGGWAFNSGGPAGQLNLNLETKRNWLISIGYEIVETSSADVSNALSLNFGRLHKFEGGIISTSIGPSRRNIPSVLAGYADGFWGLSLRASVLLAKKFIGLGISPFANISKKSYGGITVNLSLGRILYRNPNTVD